MAEQTIGPNKTYKAAADLSSSQYHIVKQTSAGVVNLASAATDVITGVLQNKPKSGENAEVCMRNGGGTGKVKLGGNVAIGSFLTADASGHAVATTTGGNEVFGRAIEAGVSGDVIEYEPCNYLYRTS